MSYVYASVLRELPPLLRLDAWVLLQPERGFLSLLLSLLSLLLRSLLLSCFGGGVDRLLSLFERAGGSFLGGGSLRGGGVLLFWSFRAGGVQPPELPDEDGAW